MTTENISTLKIHKMSQEQYDRELAAGRIEENAIYLTPDVNSLEVDSILSTTSINPIQNKVVAQALEGKMNSSGNNSLYSSQVLFYGKGDGWSESKPQGSFFIKLGTNDLLQMGYGGPEGENYLYMSPDGTATLNGSQIATENYVNSTINEALGVIENGSY